MAKHKWLFWMGLFLIGEAAVSLIFSQDQRWISHAGRLARALIGIYLIRLK